MYSLNTHVRSLGTVALVSLAFAACASTGATFRSGVGDTFLEHPPWLAGADASLVGGDSARLGHLPIAFQRGASESANFDAASGAGSAVESILAEMNAYLDSLGSATALTIRLVEGGRVSAVAHRASTSPPDVQFGCLTELGLPGNDCAERGDSALGRGRQHMRLAVGRPSPEWTAWVNEVMGAQGVSRTLVLTLEVGHYLPRQRGLRGAKEVELGTGHTQSLPWLTSLETPVAVLQLTGAIVGGDGRAIRIGAEGFALRRTRLAVSALGGAELLGEEDVAESRTARRDDLPGRPLAWQVAMRHLVANLTGRRELAP